VYNCFCLVVPFMLFSPLPIMLAANCADDGMFSSEKSGPAVEFGFFLTGILLTSVFALPVVLMLSGAGLDGKGAGMSVVGAACVMASIFIYQVIFNASPSDE
jgi:hypothetical protein